MDLSASLTQALSSTQRRIAEQMGLFAQHHQERLDEYRRCVTDELERQRDEVDALMQDAIGFGAPLAAVESDPVEWSSSTDQVTNGAAALYEEGTAPDVCELMVREGSQLSELSNESDLDGRNLPKASSAQSLTFNNFDPVVTVPSTSDSDPESITLERSAEEKKRHVSIHFESALKLMRDGDAPARAVKRGRQSARMSRVSQVSTFSAKAAEMIGLYRTSTGSVNSQEEAVDRLRNAYEAAAQLVEEAHRSTPNALDRLLSHSLQKGNSMRMEVASVSLFGGVAQWAEEIVDNKLFNWTVAILIMFNSILIGVQTQLSIHNAIENFRLQDQIGNADLATPVWLFVFDIGFNVVFFLELVLRVLALEGRFCAGSEWKWNGFDALVLSLSMVDMALLAVDIKASHVRVLRLARSARTLRMLRLLRYTATVRKLRVITLAIINSRTMFMWAVVVLLLVLYLFSVIFLYAVSQYIADAAPDDIIVEDLTVFFDSLEMTMLTLFMSVSGGLDWWDIMSLLLKISVQYALLFLLFIVITILAILNVINAIFVNDAMECTHMDIDLRMQGELEETKQMLERLTRIFQDMCPDASGIVRETDFVSHVERDEMRMVFSLIGLQFTDGVTLFKLLDVDGNMQLGIDEFVMGCLRLKGGAVQIDNHVLIRDIKQLLRDSNQKQRKSVSALAQGVRDIRHYMDEDNVGRTPKRGMRTSALRKGSSDDWQ